MKKILFYTILLLTSTFCGCKGSNNKSADKESMVIAGQAIDSLRICQAIDSLVALDKDTSIPAVRVALRFYKDNHRICWISSQGVTSQAKSLIGVIGKVRAIGFDPSQFYYKEIAADKRLVDSLDFSKTDAYTAIARLDLNLTKAFLCYAGGEKYGFTNPDRIFSRLDAEKNDSVVTGFRTLYCVPTETATWKFYQRLAALAGTDSVEAVLRDAEPQGTQGRLYQQLKTMLPKASATERQRILANMERCRWQHPHQPSDYRKYVLVNIPSYELLGVDGDSVLQMKMVCGTRTNKTPLFSSSIMRMDVNPTWGVPLNMLRSDIAPHAGSSAYFAAHHYHITETATGMEYDPAYVTRAQIESGAFSVVQEGGEGNTLGRFKFYFDNKLNIFLHDTSTKSTFSKEDRSASHGCIRVQKPFDLACFLLKDKNQALIDKIRYSMAVKKSETIDQSRYVHNIKVSPRVPLFITYYTMYLMPDGKVHSYNDIYGYDPVIYGKIEPFTKARPK